MALEVDGKIWQKWFRNKKNMNISKTFHAIHAQMSTIMRLTSEHIVLKYEVNCTVPFWDIVKKRKSTSWRQLQAAWHLADNLRYPHLSLTLYMARAYKGDSLLYLMTSVEISGEKGVLEIALYSNIWWLHSYGPWDKSKNPCPLRDCVIPNSATNRAPEISRPAALWFLNPYGHLIGDYAIFQWAWVLAIICHGVPKILQ